MNTSFGPAVLILSAFALPPLGSAQPVKEPAHMPSDPGQGNGQAVLSLLETYDAGRDPAQLQAAADRVAAEAPQQGEASPSPDAMREKLGLWLAVLARFGRDLDPGFDPARPPPLTVAPPKVGNAQMPPGVRPSDLKDPEARAQYEAAIADNAKRVQAFKLQARLYALHETVLHDATDFLKGAEQAGGLSAADVQTALGTATLLPSDRTALTDAVPAR